MAAISAASKLAVCSGTGIERRHFSERRIDALKVASLGCRLPQDQRPLRLATATWPRVGTSRSHCAFTAIRCSASSADAAPTVEEHGAAKEAGGGPNGSSVFKGNCRPQAYDYGFQSKIRYTGPTVPASIFSVAAENYNRELLALRRNVLFDDEMQTSPPPSNVKQHVVAFASRALRSAFKDADAALTRWGVLKEVAPSAKLPAESRAMRQRLQQLTLNDAEVAKKERRRGFNGAPLVILVPYQALCFMLDAFFANRPIQRFWFLETVARMPYFS